MSGLTKTNNVSNPDWASSINVFIGAMGTDETMGETLANLGAIDTDALTIETADGTVLELKDINGKLLAKMQQEPTITINFTLLSPSEETKGKFWEMEEAGTGDTRKVKVTSLVQNTPMSFRFANTATPGSVTFEAAKCSISMNMAYAANKGYTGVCKATLMWPQRAAGETVELFQFGVIPTATPAE